MIFSIGDYKHWYLKSICTMPKLVTVISDFGVTCGEDKRNL